MCVSMQLTRRRIGVCYTIERMTLRNEGLRRRLQALGVTEGSRIQLLQKYPAFVVACEGTQLAMDACLAEKIWVMQ